MDDWIQKLSNRPITFKSNQTADSNLEASQVPKTGLPVLLS